MTGSERSPPGVRELHIAYGGDPDEFDRMVERYLRTDRERGDA